MKYNDIKPTVKILLEQEKKNFIKAENQSLPRCFYSPEKNHMCYIITAPFECEAMQVVGEFNQVPALKNLTRTYAIVGNQVTDIEKRIVISLISQSFNLSVNDQEKLKAIYNQLLMNSNNHDFISYINYCKNTRNIKKNNR